MCAPLSLPLPAASSSSSSSFCLQADKGDKTVKDLVQLLFDTSLLASGECSELNVVCMELDSCGPLSWSAAASSAPGSCLLLSRLSPALCRPLTSPAPPPPSCLLCSPALPLPQASAWRTRTPLRGASTAWSSWGCPSTMTWRARALTWRARSCRSWRRMLTRAAAWRRWVLVLLGAAGCCWVLLGAAGCCC